ncbi:MAG: BsuPI-related putative proteinase inhibitor [bacterium]
MSTIKKIGIFVALASLTMVILGWGNAPKLPPENKYQPVLVLEKHDFQAGEPVKLTIILSNESGSIVKDVFSSGQSYDFIVLDDNNNIIWQWSNKKVFTMAIRPIVLRPGENLVFTEIWDQVDNLKDKVKPGKYFIKGIFNVNPNISTGLKPIIINE